MNDAYGNTKFNRIAQGNDAIATAGNKTIAVLIGIMGQAPDCQQEQQDSIVSSGNAAGQFGLRDWE